jgi:beta-mannosidase
VLISPYLHDDQVDVYVVSDKQQALSGRMRVRVLDFTGKTLLEQSQDIQIPALSSASYLKLTKDAVAAKADLRRSFLVADLEVGGQMVSRNLIFFDVTHALDLPVAPRIESNLSKVDGGYSITLRTPALARNVYMSYGDLDVRMSDNFFDLLPGEPVAITLKTSSTLDQLKSALKITSLTEAFQPAAP